MALGDPNDPNNYLTYPSGVSNTNFSPLATLFGGGITAGAQFNAGQTSGSLMAANSRISALQAQSTNQAGAEQAEIYRQRLNQTIGRQAASIGGAGVTSSGSPLRSLENTASFGAQDIARIQLNSARKAWGFSVTGAGDAFRAQEDRSAGTMNAMGSLITTGARAYGNWSTT